MISCVGVMLEWGGPTQLLVFLSLLRVLLGNPADRWETSVNINLKNTHPVSDKLYGIFFEGTFRELDDS